MASAVEWRQQRERVRRAWVAVALGICAMLLAGSVAVFWYSKPWGAPLVLGTCSGTLVAILLMGTWRTQCVIRRPVF